MCTPLESFRRVPKVCSSLQHYCSFRTAKTVQTPSGNWFFRALAFPKHFHVYLFKTTCSLGCSSVRSAWLVRMKPWVQSQPLIKAGVVMHTCNSSTGKTEGEVSEGGPSWLHSEFKTNLGHPPKTVSKQNYSKTPHKNHEFLSSQKQEN